MHGTSQLSIPPIRIETVDEPGAVAMGVRQLRQHAPGALGHCWRERNRQKRAGEDADRLAGRLRYASVQVAPGLPISAARPMTGSGARPPRRA